jgi:hypothetical protein
MTNCFAIMYQIGFHFVARNDGPGQRDPTQCGSDVGPLAVKVDAVQRHAGVSFVNGQFMSTIEVAETNTGPVKFTACGFWGTDETSEHARLRGSGHVTFTACHFTDWARRNADAPCIVAASGGLTVNGCEFLDQSSSKKHIELGEDVEAAVIIGNRFHAGPKIINRSEGEVAIRVERNGQGDRRLTRALDDGDADKLAQIWKRRLESGSLERQPAALRLASAQLLSGEMRQKLLRSFTGDDLFAKRAKDELALDDGKPIERPIVEAAGSLADAKPARLSDGTEFRVAYDDRVLTFAVRPPESNPDKLRAEQTKTDAPIWTDDSIELFICPDRVTHKYYQLIVNSRGVAWHGVGTLRATDATAWNPKLDIKAARESDAWTMTVRIPWSELHIPMPSPKKTWAIDVRRWSYTHGNADYINWSGAPASGADHHPEAFGFVRFR